MNLDLFCDLMWNFFLPCSVYSYIGMQTFSEDNSFLTFGMLCDFLYDGSFCEGLLGDCAVLWWVLVWMGSFVIGFFSAAWAVMWWPFVSGPLVMGPFVGVPHVHCTLVDYIIWNLGWNVQIMNRGDIFSKEPLAQSYTRNFFVSPLSVLLRSPWLFGKLGDFVRKT
jgi:hypothetical protein